MDRGRDPACIPAPPNTENRAPNHIDPRPEGRRWDPAQPGRPAGSGASDKPGPARGRARGCPLSGCGCARRDGSARASGLPPEPRADGVPGSLVRASSSASLLTAASELLPRPVHHRRCLSPGAPRAAAARPGHVTVRGRAPLTWVPRNMASAPQGWSRDCPVCQGGASVARMRHICIGLPPSGITGLQARFCLKPDQYPLFRLP